VRIEPDQQEDDPNIRTTTRSASSYFFISFRKSRGRRERLTDCEMHVKQGRFPYLQLLRLDVRCLRAGQVLLSRPQ
jgi:hypothetical protein